MPVTTQKPKPKTAQAARRIKRTPDAPTATSTVAKPARKTGPWKLPIWPELAEIIDVEAAIRATTNL